jgi:hypothetical protein
MEIWMNKLLVALCAGTCVLPFSSALADDQTLPDYTPAEQAQYKQEADAKKSEWTEMTSGQKETATKAQQARALSYEDHIEFQTQNPLSRNIGISKSYAATKNEPKAPRGTINTPEAEKLLMKNKGQ